MLAVVDVDLSRSEWTLHPRHPRDKQTTPRWEVIPALHRLDAGHPQSKGSTFAVEQWSRHGRSRVYKAEQGLILARLQSDALPQPYRTLFYTSSIDTPRVYSSPHGTKEETVKCNDRNLVKLIESKQVYD